MLPIVSCRLAWLSLCLLAVLVLTGCEGKPAGGIFHPEEPGELPDKLSQLGLFQGDPVKQIPAPGVLAYDLNSPLFSDYTVKHRFIKLPPGKTMKHQGDDEPLDFPIDTIIAKTFAYPHDQRDPKQGETLLETRILRRGIAGWDGVSYIWNPEQTEATIKLIGTVTPSKWIHYDGAERMNAYIVPNANQCKSCHGLSNQPIGPKPRNLQRDFAQSPGPANQLKRWLQMEVLQLPDIQPVTRALPVWNDSQTGSLDQRARAWLDINCAHCHNPNGGARQSGLDLRYTQIDSTALGIMKIPVAAGRGSGGRSYDIVPGKPDDSILIYRLESTEPGIMMPELPRRMVDVEGVQLIRQWIGEMKK